MVKFVSTFGDQFGYAYLEAAMEEAEKILQPESPFLQKIAKIDRFAMSNIPRAQLARLFQQQLSVKVEVYCPFNRFSRALGYSEDGEDVIHVNVYKFNSSMASLIATLVHTVVPVLDFHDSEHVFDHGEVFSQGKENFTSYRLHEVVNFDRDHLESYSDDLFAPQKYGGFVFYHGVGYEVARDGLYRLTKNHLEEEDPGSWCVLL